MMDFTIGPSYVRDSYKVTIKCVFIFFVKILNVPWRFVGFIGFLMTPFFFDSLNVVDHNLM